MSIEQAMIQRAAPRMLARRLAGAIDTEVVKGCLPDILPTPVRLEPRFQALGTEPSSDSIGYFMTEPPPPEAELVRMRVWISPDQKCDWNRSEVFLKQLAGLTHRAAYEIAGNREALHIDFLVHRQDSLLVSTAFRAMFHVCELSVDLLSPTQAATAGQRPEVRLVDFHPPAP